MQTEAMTELEKIHTSTSPARLYALLLRLRPLQQGTLMPFSGELVHGAFLKWLRAAAPDVAAWLHSGQKRRLFTCSSLLFSPSLQPHIKAERENTHLPLDPQKTYIIRLTLLLGDLFPIFHDALTRFDTSHLQTNALPFIQLGKQIFLLEEVILENEHLSGWTGFTSLASLIEQASQAKLSSTTPLTLEFASLTTFNRGSKKTGYGTYPVILPLPQFVFQNLLKRWQDVAPPELINVIQTERLEQYLQDDGIIITDYHLTAHRVTFTTHVQRGFLGTCTYQLRDSAEQVSSQDPAVPLTLHQQIYLLARLAFYSGIGYKTAMGLGQARLRV
ncbi:MAG: CRISPR system precrRNA processing endoribonuclease RAMP protein Cas6 [Ktedonobacteraceae bacterium]|nr:CRISPR system precrRNA processing endoribonuclease RAMP protein Cas6 [Ktedonobacteraceae bacterium]